MPGVRLLLSHDAIDGTTAPGSHDTKNDPGLLHVVTAWSCEYGLALGRKACAR